jgi:quinol monooxygenase YgiN
MAFIQIIEFRTSRFDEADAYVDEYRKTTEGKRTTKRVRVCQDRDNPGRYFTIAEFASPEDAERNSEMPETTKLSEQLQSLAQGPPTFYNLDVVRDES